MSQASLLMSRKLLHRPQLTLSHRLQPSSDTPQYAETIKELRESHTSSGRDDNEQGHSRPKAEPFPELRKGSQQAGDAQRIGKQAKNA
jgi:hypothetical protein